MNKLVEFDLGGVSAQAFHHGLGFRALGGLRVLGFRGSRRVSKGSYQGSLYGFAFWCLRGLCERRVRGSRLRECRCGLALKPKTAEILPKTPANLQVFEAYIPSYKPQASNK